MSFVYKCDCIYVQEEKIRKNWYRYRNRTREFVKVDLNKEGNCVHCGHSVVAFPKYIYPKVQQAGGYFKMASNEEARRRCISTKTQRRIYSFCL